MKKPILVATVALAFGCGGKVDFIEGSGTGATHASTSTGASSSSTSSAQGGAGAFCKAADHTIHASDYDMSCNVDSDCVPAFFGDLCGACDCPLSGAINVADQDQYAADVHAKEVGTPTGGCFCPASHGVCQQGLCGVQVP